MDTPYAVSAAAWSSLGFVLGFITSTFSARRSKKTETGGPVTEEVEEAEGVREPSRHRWILAVVVAVTLMSGLQLAWFSYQQRQDTACQAEYNRDFIEALRVRGVIADSDRNNLTQMVQAIVNAKSGEESRQALNDYLAAKARNDAERQRTPYPSFSSSAHC